MKSTKESTAAFIVRIWIEPREIKGAPPIWRGVVEDVERKERVYFDHLDTLNSYLAQYLKGFEIDLDTPAK